MLQTPANLQAGWIQACGSEPSLLPLELKENLSQIRPSIPHGGFKPLRGHQPLDGNAILLSPASLFCSSTLFITERLPVAHEAT